MSGQANEEPLTDAQQELLDKEHEMWVEGGEFASQQALANEYMHERSAEAAGDASIQVINERITTTGK